MLLYSQWLSLPLSTRNKIASEFGIIKKGSTEVFANTIRSDGYFIKDIESAITLHSMQKYLGTSETDINILWNLIVDKAEGREMKIVDIKIDDSIISPQSEVTIKRRGRPKKIQ